MSRRKDGASAPSAARSTPDELTSGFVRLDFLLTFTVTDDAARARLVSLCEEEWSGTRVGSATWEVSTALSPAGLEEALAPFLGARGDFAVFYYLADAKPDVRRWFRVVVSG